MTASKQSGGKKSRKTPSKPKLKLVGTCGPKPKYPWSKWMDGKTHRITLGKHFHSSTHSICVVLANYAGKKQKGIRTVTVDENTVEFQFFNKPTERQLRRREGAAKRLANQRKKAKAKSKSKSKTKTKTKPKAKAKRSTKPKAKAPKPAATAPVSSDTNAA